MILLCLIFFSLCVLFLSLSLSFLGSGSPLTLFFLFFSSSSSFAGLVLVGGTRECHLSNINLKSPHLRGGLGLQISHKNALPWRFIAITNHAELTINSRGSFFSLQQQHQQPSKSTYSVLCTSSFSLFTLLLRNEEEENKKFLIYNYIILFYISAVSVLLLLHGGRT